MICKQTRVAPSESVSHGSWADVKEEGEPDHPTDMRAVEAPQDSWNKKTMGHTDLVITSDSCGTGDGDTTNDLSEQKSFSLAVGHNQTAGVIFLRLIFPRIDVEDLQLNQQLPY